MASRHGRGEGTIFKRSDGRWEATIDLGWRPNGGRHRKSFYGQTRAEAASKLREAQAAVDRGQPLLDARVTVGDFLGRWLGEVVKPRRSFGHWRNCEQYVRLHILPELGRVTLAKLSAADVEGLVNATRAKGLSDDSVRLVHATLRAALTVAKRWGLVHDNVATLTEPVSVRREEVTPFAEDEVGRLLEVARDDPLGAYVTVAVALGLRPGEARALKWEDIQLDGAYPSLRVRRAFRRAPGGEALGEPKTPKSRRTIALPEQCVAALRARRSLQLQDRLRAGQAWEEQGFVFTSSVGGPLSSHTVSRWFARLCRSAGVAPGHRLYDCRHTAATLLLGQGVHPRVVMDVLGHSTFRLTMDTYSHVMPAVLREAAEATEAALRRSMAAANQLRLDAAPPA
jgi:integrase